MKKLAIVMLLLLALFLLPLINAAGPRKVYYARLVREGNKYTISSVKVVIDYALPNEVNGRYLAKLINAEGNTLYQLKLPTPVNISPPPADMNLKEKKEWYEKLTTNYTIPITLPYLKEAKTLSFEHGTSVLARADLSQLCNKDGKCNNNENYLSCPEDCQLNKKDNYCLAQADGTCDPDCAQGIDPDCKTTTKQKPANNIIGLILTGAIAVTVILIIWSKKRKK